MHPRERIEQRAQALRAAGQWREPERAAEDATDAVTAGVVDARSNDYLGLGARLVSRETELARRVGSGASRLVSGTHAEHVTLERELADWQQTEAALVFSSGYAANVGAISALAGPGETILSDALNHASIIDGCRLSRANVVVLPHADLGALRQALADVRGVCWVVTESYFGMDGDVPDLVGVRRLCDAAGAAMVVDEAHAVGVFGPEGRGACAEQDVVPDVVIGGMGKALGVQGGFVACSNLFRGWLWNRSRSLVFSTAPSPVVCALAREQLRALRGADRQRTALRALESQLAGKLRAGGVDLPEARRGPIFPIVFGAEATVMRASAMAAELGVLCHPIRPPTVPRGGSRLRVSLRADMTETQVAHIGSAVVRVWQAARLIDDAALPSVHGSSLDLQDGEGRSVLAPPDARHDPILKRETQTDPQRADIVGSTDRAHRAATREPKGTANGTPTDAPRGVSPRSDHDAGSFGPPSSGGDPSESSYRGVARATACASSEAGRLSSQAPLSPADDNPSTEPSASPEHPTPTSESGPPLTVDAVQVTAVRRKSSVARPESLNPLPPNERRVEQLPFTPTTRPQRWLILGTGTGIGKTFVAHGLVRLLARDGVPVAGLKPIETGLSDQTQGDAATLAGASFAVSLPSKHPLYGFDEPIAPARAARAAGRRIDLQSLVTWVHAVEAGAPAGAQLVIESAGGVFSPLDDDASNFDLARALDPARWVLVAPDRLGVLHDVGSCLLAMEALGRRPDYLVLSAPERTDSSTGTNHEELARDPRTPPIIDLPRNDPSPLRRLLTLCGSLAGPVPRG